MRSNITQTHRESQTYCFDENYWLTYFSKVDTAVPTVPFDFRYKYYDGHFYSEDDYNVLTVVITSVMFG